MIQHTITYRLQAHMNYTRAAIHILKTNKTTNYKRITYYLLKLTSIPLAVSRSFATWITGSWLQPCGPVTRAAGSEPTSRSWGHRIWKFSHGIGPSKFFRSCFSASQNLDVFRKTQENMCFCRKNPTSQKLLFRLLRSWVLPIFPSSTSSLLSPLSNFMLVHPSTICSAKQVKVVAFSNSRATVRATRSDRPGPVSADFRWSWTIRPHGTQSCPTVGKSYYFDMFR